MPFIPPRQTPPNYVRTYVGCLSFCRQKSLAYRWIEAICLQYESRVSTHLRRKIDLDLLTNSSSGPAAHGDYVFGWKGDTLQKAMDNSCNLNVACPKAGLTVQTPEKYNACHVPQRSVETVDGCKSNHPTIISAIWCANMVLIGLKALPLGNPAEGGTPTEDPAPQDSGIAADPQTTFVTLPAPEAPSPTAAPAGGTLAKYSQCGGSGWAGSGSCISGTTCTFSNQWYSQCL